MEIKLGQLLFPLLCVRISTAAKAYGTFFQNGDSQNFPYPAAPQENSAVRVYPGASQFFPSLPTLHLPFVGQFVPHPSTPQVIPPSGPYNDAPLRFDLARLGSAMPVLQPALTRLAYNPEAAGVAGTAPLVQPAVPTRVVYLPDIRTIPPPPQMIRPAFQPPLIRLPEYVPRVPTAIPARPRYPFLPLDRIRTRPATAYLISGSGPRIVAVIPHTFPYPERQPTFQYGQPPIQYGQQAVQFEQTSPSQVPSGNQVHTLYAYVDSTDGAQKVLRFSADPQIRYNRGAQKRG